MPIYEYDCRGCGRRVEVLVRGAERPRCPSCRDERLEKRFSTFAVGKGAPQAAPRACGTCGDPRGPGSCAAG